jgi:hypothetical protein
VPGGSHFGLARAQDLARLVVHARVVHHALDPRQPVRRKHSPAGGLDPVALGGAMPSFVCRFTFDIAKNRAVNASLSSMRASSTVPNRVASVDSSGSLRLVTHPKLHQGEHLASLDGDCKRLLPRTRFTLVSRN